MGINNIHIVHNREDEERVILHTNYHQSKTMSVIMKHPEKRNNLKDSLRDRERDLGTLNKISEFFKFRFK